MKRVALLAVTAFMAVVLSACGERAEKRVETTAPVQQSQDSLGEAAKDADSKLQPGAATGTPGSETEATHPAEPGAVQGQ